MTPSGGAITTVAGAEAVTLCNGERNSIVEEMIMAEKVDGRHEVRRRFVSHLTIHDAIRIANEIFGHGGWRTAST
jgi:recombination DNA repair RAD52 pathway protein